MEILIPLGINMSLGVGAQILIFTIWLKEESLMSIGMCLKSYLMILIPGTIIHIAFYVTWTIHLNFNHPFPNLGILKFWIGQLIGLFGLWIIMPCNLLAKKVFRQKLIFLTLHNIWSQVVLVIVNQIIMFIWNKFPIGFQFPIAFIIAGCQELDKRVRSYLVSKMIGIIDESAAALLAINVGTRWSFFVSIRLVGTEFTTILCVVAIGFLLHLKMTYQIIKECRKIHREGGENANFRMHAKLNRLILAELIEGFTPIIYGVCILMAFYGPNAKIFSNIGNTYWSQEIKDLAPLLLTMFGLFAIDTLSVIINSICLWKMANINVIQEFCRVIRKYWLTLAIFLTANVTIYFSANDINGGIDKTGSFLWITDAGWMKLVNSSNYLTNEEKTKLLYNNTLP